MRDRGIKPEMELFNGGHVNEVYELLDRRPELLSEPLYATLIFGGGTTERPTPANFMRLIDLLPDGTLFNTLGFGQHQLPFAAMATVFGGHVRVGLEDNRYLRRGELATNEQLVEWATTLAETLERPVASPDEARDILDL